MRQPRTLKKEYVELDPNRAQIMRLTHETSQLLWNSSVPYAEKKTRLESMEREKQYWWCRVYGMDSSQASNFAGWYPRDTSSLQSRMREIARKYLDGELTLGDMEMASRNEVKKDNKKPQAVVQVYEVPVVEFDLPF